MGNTRVWPFYPNTDEEGLRQSGYGQSLSTVRLVARVFTLSDKTYMERGFTGLGGYNAVARFDPLVENLRGYRGDLPLDQMPLVNKPKPWMR